MYCITVNASQWIDDLCFPCNIIDNFFLNEYQYCIQHYNNIPEIKLKDEKPHQRYEMIQHICAINSCGKTYNARLFQCFFFTVFNHYLSSFIYFCSYIIAPVSLLVYLSTCTFFSFRLNILIFCFHLLPWMKKRSKTLQSTYVNNYFIKYFVWNRMNVKRIWGIYVG